MSIVENLYITNITFGGRNIIHCNFSLRLVLCNFNISKYHVFFRAWGGGTKANEYCMWQRAYQNHFDELNWILYCNFTWFVTLLSNVSSFCGPCKCNHGMGNPTHVHSYSKRAPNIAWLYDQGSQLLISVVLCLNTIIHNYLERPISRITSMWAFRLNKCTQFVHASHGLYHVGPLATQINLANGNGDMEAETWRRWEGKGRRFM